MKGWEKSFSGVPRGCLGGDSLEGLRRGVIALSEISRDLSDASVCYMMSHVPLSSPPMCELDFRALSNALVETW